MSPTQRSLKVMRDRGYTVAVVEHWNQWARIRQDLFGFIDLLCLGEDGQVVAVQTTSASNVSARVTKISEHPNLAVVRRAGWRIVVQGWRKAANGKWTLREVDIS